MSKRTHIKICGITSAEDAERAVLAGADYIGLIFVDTSPRRVLREAAIAIRKAVPGNVQLVGVFQNSAPADIKVLWEQVGFDLVQLHGQERIEDYSTLPLPSQGLNLSTPRVQEIPPYGRDDTGFWEKQQQKTRVIPSDSEGSPESNTRCEAPRTLRLIRALSLDLEALPSEPLRTLMGPAQYLLLDRPKASHRSDWLAGALAYVSSVNDCPPLFFAGGLTADNVASVLSHVQPYGVDVASGVEAEPGVKDPQKLLAFCQAVQACDNALQQQREIRS